SSSMFDWLTKPTWLTMSARSSRCAGDEASRTTKPETVDCGLHLVPGAVTHRCLHPGRRTRSACPSMPSATSLASASTRSQRRCDLVHVLISPAAYHNALVPGQVVPDWDPAV